MNNFLNLLNLFNNEHHQTIWWYQMILPFTLNTKIKSLYIVTIFDRISVLFYFTHLIRLPLNKVIQPK